MNPNGAPSALAMRARSAPPCRDVPASSSAPCWFSVLLEAAAARPLPLARVGRTGRADALALCRWSVAVRRAPAVWPGSFLARASFFCSRPDVGCGRYFSRSLSYSLLRPNPRAPRCCCARPSGLARGPVPLLLLPLVRCFGRLAGFSRLVRLLVVRCLWLRRAGGWPRAAGLGLPSLLLLLWLLFSLRGWPCPPRLLVVPLSWPFVLLGAAVLLASLLVGAGVPPALRRSSARGGWAGSLWWVRCLVLWSLPLLRW